MKSRHSSETKLLFWCYYDFRADLLDKRRDLLDKKMVLAIILSATDPVAVVALLKDLGCEAKLSTFIEGESLMNDGTAIVIFTVLLKAVQNGVFTDSFSDVILTFTWMAFGGPLLGLVSGWFFVSWIGYVFNTLCYF